MYDFKLDISHRYLAVQSGVGWFGLSGNVIAKQSGASVVLGSVVTTALLEPTEPLPEDEKYCDECKLCMASCSIPMAPSMRSLPSKLKRTWPR
jgi:epoxyqueuosine reductase QueG